MALDPQSIAALDPNDVVRAIQLGIADDHLRSIEHAVKMRHQVKLHSFRPGQKVRLNDKVSPKYLVGCTATVVKVNKTRLVVDFDAGQYLGKFGSGRGVTCPLSILEAV